MLKVNNVALKSFLGGWDVTNPSSSNVIYDEQSPFPPPSHAASMFEESHRPVTEESLMRVQICEKAEEFKDTVPEKKSTLNEQHSDIKHQTLLQKNVSKRDPRNSHGYSDKKSLLKAENSVRQTGRSASPKKSASHYSEDHLEKTPPKNNPKRRPRERSLSPRKGESRSCQTSPKAGSGQDHGRKSRGRSPSPKQQHRTEGSNDHSNTEAKLLEFESRRAGGHAGDHVEQISEGRERSGVTRKDIKQSESGKNRARSPEKSKRMVEKSLPSSKTKTTRVVVSENDKGKKATSGETSSSKDKLGENVRTSEKQRKQEPEERLVLNKVQDHKGKELEASDKSKESGGFKPEGGSPARKPPITPGPWKVPGANKATGTSGVAEKRL